MCDSRFGIRDAGISHTSGKNRQGGGTSMGRWLRAAWGAAVYAMCAPVPVVAQEVLEECPREHLRAVYLQAVERHEVVDLAAVEVEVLKLCRERQELVSEIVQGEEELADLLAGRGSDGSARAGAPGSGPGGLPALLPALAGGESRGDPSLASSNTGRGERAGARYRWLIVYGSGSDLVAGVTDGVERWWVRAGDRLPGGVEVVSVGVRPISVRAAAGGRQWQLPGPGRGSVTTKEEASR